MARIPTFRNAVEETVGGDIGRVVRRMDGSREDLDERTEEVIRPDLTPEEVDEARRMAFDDRIKVREESRGVTGDPHGAGLEDHLPDLHADALGAPYVARRPGGGSHPELVGGEAAIAIVEKLNEEMVQVHQEMVRLHRAQETQLTRIAQISATTRRAACPLQFGDEAARAKVKARVESNPFDVIRAMVTDAIRRAELLKARVPS